MFKALATLQYSFSSAKVYVIRGHVAKGFVIAPRVVVGDKTRDLLHKIVGILPYDPGYFLLAGSMIPFDLPVGLRVIRRSEYMGANPLAWRYSPKGLEMSAEPLSERSFA